MINIAILGFGIIGSGTYEVITANSVIIAKRLGKELCVRYVLDIRDIDDEKIKPLLTRDVNDILADPSVSVVVEAMGGSNPAYEYSAAALRAGKHVVTSNKEVVANFGAELLALAKEHNVSYLFEASVGGGIPVIRPMHNCLAANRIDRIAGILNGTTNFILTKMRNEGCSYEDALVTAQSLGYAESDPSADVDGVDACRKICILAALAFGRSLPPDKVYTQGIRGVKLSDIRNAGMIGKKIKLIAMAEQCDDGGVFAMVSPRLVDTACPLHGIEDVFNGIVIDGNAIGEVMFYGKGAGKLPTASAVAADVMDALTSNTKEISWDSSDGSYLLDHKSRKQSWYVSVETVVHVPEMSVREHFPGAAVHNGEAGIFFITAPMREDCFTSALEGLCGAGFKCISAIRLL